MEKKNWFTVEIEGLKGSTRIFRSLHQAATSAAEATKIAKDRFVKMEKGTSNITIKKTKKW